MVDAAWGSTSVVWKGDIAGTWAWVSHGEKDVRSTMEKLLLNRMTAWEQECEFNCTCPGSMGALDNHIRTN
jgi:hypothetical protein